MKLFPRAVRDRLAWAAAASVALPWLAGAWVKRGIESEMPVDLARRVLLIDFLVAGTILAALSLLLAVAVGCCRKAACSRLGCRRCSAAWTKRAPGPARRRPSMSTPV